MIYIVTQWLCDRTNQRIGTHAYKNAASVYPGKVLQLYRGTIIGAWVVMQTQCSSYCRRQLRLSLAILCDWPSAPALHFWNIDTQSFVDDECAQSFTKSTSRFHIASMQLCPVSKYVKSSDIQTHIQVLILSILCVCMLQLPDLLLKIRIYLVLLHNISR